MVLMERGRSTQQKQMPAKFDITASGALVSKTALDFSTQSSFDLGIHLY